MPRSALLRRSTVATVAVFALTAAACASDSSSTGAGDGGSATIQGTLTDTMLTLAPSSTGAGEVTFEVANTGTQIHEIEVFKGDVAPDALPVENNVANTTDLELIDEVEDIAPGTTAELSVDLDAGTYVIVCNLPGHYQSGLHAGFTVS